MTVLETTRAFGPLLRSRGARASHTTVYRSVALLAVFAAVISGDPSAAHADTTPFEEIVYAVQVQASPRVWQVLRVHGTGHMDLTTSSVATDRAVRSDQIPPALLGTIGRDVTRLLSASPRAPDGLVAPAGTPFELRIHGGSSWTTVRGTLEDAPLVAHPLLVELELLVEELEDGSDEETVTLSGFFRQEQSFHGDHDQSYWALEDELLEFPGGRLGYALQLLREQQVKVTLHGRHVQVPVFNEEEELVDTIDLVRVTQIASPTLKHLVGDVVSPDRLKTEDQTYRLEGSLTKLVGRALGRRVEISGFVVPEADGPTLLVASVRGLGIVSSGVADQPVPVEVSGRRRDALMVTQVLPTVPSVFHFKQPQEVEVGSVLPADGSAADTSAAEPREGLLGVLRQLGGEDD